MEKFFIVTEKSQLHKDYLDYEENKKKINEVVKEFMEKQGIEATEYFPTNECLYIMPSENDIKKFDKYLCKPERDGTVKFKKNSKVNKYWIELLKIKDLEVKYKPRVPQYFNRWLGGRFSTRLFEIDGVVYCSLSRNEREINTPKGMQEIKASYFFKVIEDYESRETA